VSVQTSCDLSSGTNSLQHAAIHCNILIAHPPRLSLTHLLVQIHCNTLQHMATLCNALDAHLPRSSTTYPRVQIHWKPVRHTATHCNTPMRYKIQKIISVRVRKIKHYVGKQKKMSQEDRLPNLVTRRETPKTGGLSSLFLLQNTCDTTWPKKIRKRGPLSCDKICKYNTTQLSLSLTKFAYI